MRRVERPKPFGTGFGDQPNTPALAHPYNLLLHDHELNVFSWHRLYSPLPGSYNWLSCNLCFQLNNEESNFIFAFAGPVLTSTPSVHVKTENSQSSLTVFNQHCWIISVFSKFSKSVVTIYLYSDSQLLSSTFPRSEPKFFVFITERSSRHAADFSRSPAFINSVALMVRRLISCFMVIFKFPLCFPYMINLYRFGMIVKH